MGRLIDTSNIRVKPQYMQDVMGIAMIRCEDLSRILADAPTVEAIPKADYKARLKADMVAMLEELKEQLREMHEDYFETEHFDEAYGLSDSIAIIQQKIDALKGEQA